MIATVMQAGPYGLQGMADASCCARAAQRVFRHKPRYVPPLIKLLTE
jgi:hypothetical protein